LFFFSPRRGEHVASIRAKFGVEEWTVYVNPTKNFTAILGIQINLCDSYEIFRVLFVFSDRFICLIWTDSLKGFRSYGGTFFFNLSVPLATKLDIEWKKIGRYKNGGR